MIFEPYVFTDLGDINDNGVIAALAANASSRHLSRSIEAVSC